MSSFQTPKGTRGARVPSGRLQRWLNKMSVNRFKRGAKFMGMNALVLTTIGKKSGQVRETPVGWFPGPDSSWLIVASAAGAANNPAWYYNLAAHPDQATITLNGEVIPIVAEELHGAERQAGWQTVIAAAPRFAEYQTKTDRELPVIRLTRRAA